MIETERLRIYPASKEKMKDFISGQANDILKTAYQEMLDGCLMHPEEWNYYAIWMIEKKDGTHIGECCFKGISPNGSTEIGYGISEEYRGRDYATEAVNAVVEWALQQHKVCSVEAETEAGNLASIRVLQKCGFLPTGEIGEEGPRFRKIRRKCIS